MPKTYNTPKRTFVVKTRSTEEELIFFMRANLRYDKNKKREDVKMMMCRNEGFENKW